MIAWMPPLPAGITVPLLLVTLAVIVWTYRRGSWPACLRATALGILALVLAGPEWIEPARIADPPVLALVLDASGSMARTDTQAGTSRHAQARAALEAVAAAAGPGWKPMKWSLTDQLTAGWPDDAAAEPLSTLPRATDFNALGELISADSTTRPAAIMLASDGADRGNATIDRTLAAANVPVSAYAVGSAQAASNIAVRLEAAAPSAFIGQDVAITAIVTASQDLLGRQARLTIDGEVRTITLAHEVRLTCTRTAGETAGELVVAANVDALPGEITDLDNHAHLAMPVVDRRLNVVLIEGQPWFDTAGAMRAWRRDRQLSVTSFQRLGSRTLVAGPGPDAQVEAKLADVLATADVIVLGIELARLVDPPAQAALTAAIERGAGVLLLGGWRPADDLATAWDPLLWRAQPQSSAVPPRVGPGADAVSLINAALLPKLPPLMTPNPAGLRPFTSVVLGTAQRPIIVTGRHGRARTACVTASGWWGWHQAEPKAAERLWRQLVKAVATGGTPLLMADRDRYHAGMQVRLAVSQPATLAPIANVSVTDPEKAASSVPVHDGVAVMPVPRAGVWQCAVSGQQLTIVVEADVREVVDDARDEARLARLAARTGGRLGADPVQLGAQLARRADLGVAAPRRTSLATAWWWWMPLVGALLAAEWSIRRRRHGVV